MRIQHCINDLVMRGCDDYIDASEVASVAITEGGATSQKEIRELAIQLIRNVVQQELMELGDLLGRDGRFHKWDLSIQECLSRVEREWNVLGRNSTLGEVCWLQNTEKGNELGEQLHRKKRNS